MGIKELRKKWFLQQPDTNTRKKLKEAGEVDNTLPELAENKKRLKSLEQANPFRNVHYLMSDFDNLQ